jgi:SAM-dependent methyltransferase
MELLNDKALARSSVVANCCMNRQRSLLGSNGYERELGLNPIDFLRDRAASQSQARWLDLCCGTGKALIEAGLIAKHEGWAERLEIVGVDLAGSFAERPAEIANVGLLKGSLAEWQADRPFDLITCVHGLHYIGDKLGLIARAASWLTKTGVFVASLDLNNIKCRETKAAGRVIGKALRASGLEYDSRKKLVSCPGYRRVEFGLRYLGADDQAGPNYTKQPVVDSYYERVAAART